MIYLGAVNTYHCSEYETVPVPISDLVGANGDVKLFPEVNSGRYFDIDYAQGRLVLRSKGIVGLIPVSERVAVHVRPRAPIANLLYMTWRAGYRSEGLRGFVRSYQIASERIEYPEDLYLRGFLNALREIERVGPLRSYKERSTDRELRGRLRINPTVTRLRARGVAHRAVFNVHELTADISENRIVKYIAVRLLQHMRARTDPELRADFARLRRGLGMFEAVDSSKTDPTEIARLVPALVRGLPRSHSCYESILWLCELIATRSGVLMEKLGNNRLDTILIDVGVVFENYVRRICEDYAASHLGGCQVIDGNKRPVYLFVDNRRHPARPDCYFRRGANYVAIVDAKYKRRLEAEDRYELLGFCEALQVNSAAFICPKSDSVPTSELHGVTPGGKRLFLIPLDLGATDFAKEESRFAQELGTLLIDRSTPP